MILIDGVVSIYKHDSKGNEVVIGYFNKYALLAEAAVLRKSPLPSSARFQTDGSILKISLDGFENFLLSHSKLAYEIIQSLLEKIDLLQQNIHFNLAATSKEKVLNFYQKNPKLALDLKQYEIASILGMTPETLSRNISKLLKEEKLVQTAAGYKVP
jgi:CRP/FNR family transcriptional regulator